MEQLEKIELFSQPLLAWYRRHQRDLPWRRSRNPYYIWISEVMLQQTRVDTVIPYYHRFLDKFPTIEALADAPEEEVLKLWEGLGYYSRARNLQAAVREVKEQYGSTVPDTKEEVSSLKGVGPYTAGAILSIAYNKPEPAVDGNVMRVLSRFFLLQDDIAKPSTRIGIEALAKTLIPEGEARDFNQALMELGATVCTPKSPSCLTCPVMEPCAARLEGMTEALPVKAKAKPPRQESRLVAFVEGPGDARGRFLVRQRPQDGLLARMWELPHVAGVEAPAALAAGGGKRRRRSEGGADGGGGALDLFAASPPEQSGRAASKDAALLRDELADQYGLIVEPMEWMMEAEHTFSHIQWKLDVYRCRFVEQRGQDESDLVAEEERDTAGTFRWIDVSDMERYAFPNVFLRIIRELNP